MGHKNELFLSGEHRFNEYFTVGTGLSTSFEALPQHFYLFGELNEFPRLISFRLAFLSRNFPQYGIQESSIYPTMALNLSFLKFELGMAYRILNSDVSTGTTHLLYGMTFYILNRERYSLSLNISNFSNFKAGNVSDISYTLKNRFLLNNIWSLSGDAGFTNSGQISFASFYSSFNLRLGVIYSL